MNPCYNEVGLILDIQRESKPYTRVGALALFPTGEAHPNMCTAFL